MDKPDVDSIEGLSPAISIDQKTTSRNPRSTVGTVTEIYDYLRLLWARVGASPLPHLRPPDRRPVDRADHRPGAGRCRTGTRFMVAGAGRARAQGRVQASCSRSCAARASRACKVDGEVRLLEEEIELDKKYKHDIAVVVDRLRHARRTCASGWPTRSRPRSAWPTAWSTSSSSTSGEVRTLLRALRLPAATAPRCPSSSRGSSRSTRPTAPARAAPAWARRWRSTRSWSCPTRRCRSARARSCPGRRARRTTTSRSPRRSPSATRSTWTRRGRTCPRSSATSSCYGTNGDRIYVSYRNRYGPQALLHDRFEGIVPNLERRYRETDSDYVAREDRGVHVGAAVPGVRGRAAAARVAGGARRRDAASTSSRALSAHAGAGVAPTRSSCTDIERRIARLILREIEERLRFLDNVGVGYLSLDRAAATLSGGEAQRIRLATQIGSSLVGRALHPRRALDRPAPARQRAADRDAGAAARPRQHGDRGRARRGHDAGRRPPRRPRPGRGRARRPRGRRGHGGGGRAGRRVAHRPVPGRHAHDRGAQAPAPPPRATSTVEGATEHNLQGHRREDPARACSAA